LTICRRSSTLDVVVAAGGGGGGGEASSGAAGRPVCGDAAVSHPPTSGWTRSAAGVRRRR